MSAKRGHTIAADPTLPEMAVVTGDDPAQLARQAVEELGGIRRFIARGTSFGETQHRLGSHPEQAANTNPDVVAEIVRQCSNAGASGSLSPT